MHSHNNNIPDSPVLVRLEHVTHRFGRKEVLTDVDLDINEGDFIAITGRNGGGKTTLLRLILQLLKPTAGEVTHFPMPSGNKIRFGYLPQKNMIDSRFPITVAEVVKMGLKLGSAKLTNAEKQLVGEIVEQMGLDSVAKLPISDISGGQLQRALLGRAIISRPDVLIMDEPLSYIDRKFEKHLYSLIEQLSATTTIVLVSHDMTTLGEMASRHLIVDGKITQCRSHHHFQMLSCEV